MEFLLVIQICAKLLNQCTEPVTIYPSHNSHYDCAVAGYLHSLSIYREFGEKYVNENEILVNFSCQSLKNT
jgi:hypothetical protein